MKFRSIDNCLKTHRTVTIGCFALVVMLAGICIAPDARAQSTRPTVEKPGSADLAPLRRLMRIVNLPRFDIVPDDLWHGIEKACEPLLAASNDVEVWIAYAQSAIYFESNEKMAKAYNAISSLIASGVESSEPRMTRRALEFQMRARDGRPAPPAPEPLSEWATVIRADPDPAVVGPEARSAIAATGLPWCVRHKASEIEMVLIPPGTFLRGAPDSDPEGTAAERPAHMAKVERAFYLGRYEVTNKEYLRFDPTHLTLTRDAEPRANAPEAPAASLELRRIDLFCKGVGLRLPSHVEWEYAARAGTSAPRHGDLSKIAWCRADSKPMPRGEAGKGLPYKKQVPNSARSVGTKRPNAFGLYDMLGNVQELVADVVYSKDYRSILDSTVDRKVDSMFTDGMRVFCGGSWGDEPNACRASYRQFSTGVFPSFHRGFRVAHSVN